MPELGFQSERYLNSVIFHEAGLDGAARTH